MPWLSPRGISNMHGACMIPSEAALSSLHDPQRNSVRARACGRESFSATAKPFDPKQKGKGEHTLCAESSPARRPRRTPFSTSTAAAGDRYGELPQRKAWKHAVWPRCRSRSTTRSNSTCNKNDATHAHAMCGSRAKPSIPTRQAGQRKISQCACQI